MMDMSFNDLIQWATVVAVIVIAVVVIVRKVLQFRKGLKEGNGPSCGCGCAGCTIDCDLKKKGKTKVTVKVGKKKAVFWVIVK